MEFAYPRALQDDLAQKWGVKFYYFKAKNQIATGYEDIQNVINAGESGWVAHPVYGQVFYGVKRSVLWRYGWDPASQNELATGIFRSDSNIGYDDFITVNNLDGLSAFRDVIFRVAKVEDGGRYRTLQRICYLRIVSSAEVNKLFQKILASGQYDR
jgi:hypothetical protein